MSNWSVKCDGRVVAVEHTYRFAKQTARRIRREHPTLVVTVTDPKGRIVINHEPRNAS